MSEYPKVQRAQDIRDKLAQHGLGPLPGPPTENLVVTLAEGDDGAGAFVWSAAYCTRMMRRLDAALHPWSAPCEDRQPGPVWVHLDGEVFAGELIATGQDDDAAVELFVLWPEVGLQQATRAAEKRAQTRRRMMPAPPQGDA